MQHSQVVNNYVKVYRVSLSLNQLYIQYWGGLYVS